MTQLARFAPLYQVPIEDARADVRGTFQNSQKYGVDDAAAHFQEVVVDLQIQSTATAEQVHRLVEHAERACHTAQSLRQPVVVNLSASLNGENLER